jgi:hypothetical protein
VNKPNPFFNLKTLRQGEDGPNGKLAEHFAKEAVEPPPKTRRLKRERFVQVPIETAGQVAMLMNEPRTFIWLWTLYLVWKTSSKTVRLSNVELRKWGIARSTKRRALTAYERAGVLKVERHPGRSVVVTLLR